MASVINWFEIPTADFPRAVKFYEHVFDTRLKQEDMGPLRMGVFLRARPPSTARWSRARASSPPPRAACST